MAGHIIGRFTCPQTVTHPSSKQAECRLTLLNMVIMLTTTLRHHLNWVIRYWCDVLSGCTVSQWLSAQHVLMMKCFKKRNVRLAVFLLSFSMHLCYLSIALSSCMHVSPSWYCCTVCFTVHQCIVLHERFCFVLLSSSTIELLTTLLYALMSVTSQQP